MNHISRETADAILVIFAEHKLGLLTVEEYIDKINSLVSKDAGLAQRCWDNGVEWCRMHHPKEWRTETDNEIAKQKWEEFWAENKHEYPPDIKVEQFGDWLYRAFSDRLDSLDKEKKYCKGCKYYDPGDYDIEVWCKFKNDAFENLFSCPDWLDKEGK
jgi:hypothetical protein